MVEYIKREDALDAVLFALVGTGYQSKAIYAIRDIPTADVVPKSEVEKWKEINEQLYKELSERMIEERKIVRKLVASVIFAELEMYVEEHDGCSVNLSRCEFAELKKKYTEDQT